MKTPMPPCTWVNACREPAIQMRVLGIHVSRPLAKASRKKAACAQWASRSTGTKRSRRPVRAGVRLAHEMAA